MTLPGQIVLANGEKEDANSNSHIALALTAERKARLERMGGMGGGRTLRSGEEDGRKRGARGQGPVPVETVAKQLKRVFRKLGVHCRMELAMRVYDEIAVMRGWIKDT